MTVKHRSLHTLADPKYGKPIKITVWKNGDFESPGQEISFHQRDLRSWNAALVGFLTNMFQPRFGAVRKLYNLNTRKQVSCLKDVKEGDKLVIVGSGKFKYKRNGYLTEEEKIKKPTTKSNCNIKASKSSLLNFLSCTKKMKRTVIYLMVSGRYCQPPVKIVLIDSDLVHHDVILEYLGYRLDVTEGIQFLCYVDGKVVQHLTELKHGQVYVAVPFNEKFVKLDYHKLFDQLCGSETKKIPQRRKISLRKKKRSFLEQDVSNKETINHEEKEFVPKEPSSQDINLKQENICCAQNNSRSENDIAKDFSVIHTRCSNSYCQTSTCARSNEFGSEPAFEEQNLSNSDWEDYDLELRSKVVQMAEEVNIIKDLLDDLLDETMIQVENKEVMTADFVDYPEIDDEAKVPSSHRHQILGDLCTNDCTQKSLNDIGCSSRNLTTFAEIARQESLEREASDIRNLDQLCSLSARSDSFCSARKKSVAFLEEDIPKTVFEGIEKHQSDISSFQNNDLPDSDSLEEFTKAIIFSTVDEDSPVANNNESKFTQKDWKMDEDIAEKSVQVTPKCCEHTSVLNIKTSRTNSINEDSQYSLQAVEKRDEKAVLKKSSSSCPREKCVTFACSDIRLDKINCPADK